MSNDLERQLELSEKRRKNIEFVLDSAPKVKEVYEQLEHIQETGLAPIQKALDEITILKQHQVERHKMLMELQQAIGQVQTRDKELGELEKKVLQILLDKLAKQ